jgi:hypothetical protein
MRTIELEYTATKLAELAREVWGDNAVEYLAARLTTVVNHSQLKVLIDSLTKTR